MAQFAIPIRAVSTQFLDPLGRREDAVGGHRCRRVRGQGVGHASADPACLAAQLSNPYITGRRITGGFRSCLPDRTIRNSSWLSVRRVWLP